MNVNGWWLACGMLLSVACGGGGDGGAPDAATDTGAADTGAADTGAGDGGPSDGGGGDGATADAGRDATVPPEDGGPGGDDAGGPDGGDGADGGSCAGVECPDYAAALAAAPRGATSLDNCVVQLHQTDCCGARRAYGVNHAARESLCPAETACVATYDATASCADATVTTDTGETTTDMADVRIRVVDPTPCAFDASVTCYTCETFVCTEGACLAAPGIAGGCG